MSLVGFDHCSLADPSLGKTQIEGNEDATGSNGQQEESRQEQGRLNRCNY